jgi:hypothetical protein
MKIEEFDSSKVYDGKIVSAESAIVDGRNGYKVIYEEGRVDFYPKDVFEKFIKKG